MQEMHRLAREEDVAHLEGLARRLPLDGGDACRRTASRRQHDARRNEPRRGGEDAQHDHRHHHAREPEMPEVAAVRDSRASSGPSQA